MGVDYLGHVASLSLMYMSLFLALAHEFLMLFSSPLEVLLGIDHSMAHIVLIHVREALFHSALADYDFLIVVLSPSVRKLFYLHLFSHLLLERLGAGYPRCF